MTVNAIGQWRAMKPTQRAACEAFALGIVGAALIAWLVIPGAVWWVHWLIGAAIIAGLYKARVEQLAHEKIADAAGNVPR